MGKHEPNSAKAIAIRIKAKGLQKIKYYCPMCQKQCRDDNGFKCHIASEAHQRQALIVHENPEKFVDEYSSTFMEQFMYLLKTRHRTKRVLANTVFQDIVKDRDHVHLNSTRWTSLTEFARWLGDRGMVEVVDSERGVMVTYIDRDPETIRRRELDLKREEKSKEAAIEREKEVERQKELTRKLYKEFEVEKPIAEPVPIIKIATNEADNEPDPKGESSSVVEKIQNDKLVVEKPVFNIQAVTLRTTVKSTFKPPPQKRLKKKLKTG